MDEVPCGRFDACCLNYQHPSGMLARSSTTVASNVESIVNKFACLRCKDRDNHLKCRSSDSPYSLQIGEKLLQYYKEHCMKPIVRTTAMVAICSQASQHSYSFHLRLADAMTSHYEEISATDAEERAQEFRLALQDPDRLADALAGLSKPAAFRDISKFIREPKPGVSDPDALFLRCIPNREWFDLRKEYPTERWTTIYEIWHAERGVKVTDDMNATGALVQDASLTGWLHDLVDFLLDMAVLGFSTRAPEAYDTTKMYDLCHRFILLTKGLGGHKLFPSSVRLLGGLFTPSLQRVPPLPIEKSFALIVGDSSLALVDMKRARVTKKRSFGDELQVALRNEARCSGSEVSMLWGQGLGYIHERIIALIDKHTPRHPEGFDIYISWAGNDVYGKWGHKAFTWHHQSPWGKETAEMAKKAFEWPIKQLRQVQSDVAKICALTDRPGINSVTLINGPANGINYGLPDEYDVEMTRHAKVMAEHGIALVEPFPLLAATDRPDNFHTRLTAENMNATVMWYRALISATVVNRLVNDLRSELVANRREIVFYEHFYMNKPDSRLMIPGMKDLIIRPTRDEELPPHARDDDEQIVMDVPLLSPQQDLLLTEGEEISEVDRILLDTTPGSEKRRQLHRGARHEASV